MSVELWTLGRQRFAFSRRGFYFDDFADPLLAGEVRGGS
jgi:hypothetical protein